MWPHDYNLQFSMKTVFYFYEDRPIKEMGQKCELSMTNNVMWQCLLVFFFHNVFGKANFRCIC